VTTRISDRRKEALGRAIVSCLQYILRYQASDGSWTDWKLPPGESSAWTTAFVGYNLRLVPTHLAVQTMTARRIAAEWLLRNEFAGGGWGYNGTVGSDADSTAYAILFLASERSAILARSYGRLKSFQRPDGGFATYISQNGNDSWGVSHADVSAVAVLALLTKYRRESGIVNRGVEYVLGQRTLSGLWNSFWWNSSLYATQACLSLVRAIQAPTKKARIRQSLAEFAPSNAFESALLLSIIVSMFPESWTHAMCPLIDRLFDEQQSDGSWKSSPILRVTARDCFEPWKSADAGSLYADPNRIFTSSVVVGALCQAYALP
jgi:hypothetical protein